jgi:hypothetical protein
MDIILNAQGFYLSLSCTTRVVFEPDGRAQMNEHITFSSAPDMVPVPI